MYFFGDSKDYAKAKELYEKGLAIVKDDSDKMALLERLEDLENEMKVNN